MLPERREKIERVLNQRQPQLAVLLENVADPMNVSNVFRSCDAAGVLQVFVLNNHIPPHQCWGRKSSKGSFKWLNIRQYTNTEQCLSDVFAGFSELLLANVNPQAKSLFETTLTGSVVLAFGNEHEGASTALAQAATGHFYLPMMGMSQSLNVANAAAISLYEAIRQKLPLGHYAQSALEPSAHAALQQLWFSDRGDDLHISTAALVDKNS